MLKVQKHITMLSSYGLLLMGLSFHEIADVFGKYDFHIERMH